MSKSVITDAPKRRKLLKFCTLDENDSLQINKTDNYYYQVQEQLHITGRKYCYFVVWSPIGILVQKVKVNNGMECEEILFCFLFIFFFIFMVVANLLYFFMQTGHMLIIVLD